MMVAVSREGLSKSTYYKYLPLLRLWKLDPAQYEALMVRQEHGSASMSELVRQCKDVLGED